MSPRGLSGADFACQRGARSPHWAIMDGVQTKDGVDAEIVGRIIGGVCTAEFARTLDEAMREVAPFDLTAILIYPDDRRPELLHDGLGGISPPEVMQAYLDGGYLLDAMYGACRERRPGGLYRLAEVAPDGFFTSDYYASPHVHPCISMESGSLAEELGFLVPFPQGHYACYSLMRSNGQAPFGAGEFARLAAYAPVIRAAVLRHWADAAPPGPRPGDAEEGLETAFRTFAADLLSPREQHIVSLILRGHSSGSIGLVLGISEGTVKNHRKHIHLKLGISSQAELFARFVRHLRA